MQFMRHMVLLALLLALFELSSNVIKASTQEDKNCEEKKEEKLVERYKKFTSPDYIEMLGKKLSREESECPFEINGIHIVPTFPPIFVVDKEGNIVVDRTLHCSKQKEK